MTARKNRTKLKFYYRFILRPLRTIKLSFSYLYARIIIVLAIRGIKLPGLEKIKNKLPAAAFAVFERRLLIYEIKGERFSVRKGPIWLRKLIENLIAIFDKNKFLFLIVMKTLLAVSFIFIPIALFIVVRGMLPVPERIPYASPSRLLPQVSKLRVEWPYTEAPYGQNAASYYNMLDPNQARGVTLTPVLEPHAPAGLTHFGIGSYPSKLNLMRGFLTGESSFATIVRQKKEATQNKSENNLRIQYYLFPSIDHKEHQCKLELKDESNHLIVSTLLTTPAHDALAPESGIAKSWHELFTPAVRSHVNDIHEFVIASKFVPEKIQASAHVVETLEASSTSPSENTEWMQKFAAFYPHSTLHNLTQDQCIFALGDFSLERPVEQPLKRRGIIFILVDTLRAETAYDKKIMPNLNLFAQDNSTSFLEHRAQGNMTVPSVVALMSSRFAREVGPVAFTYAADSLTKQNFYATQTPLLATSMQTLGYRVGAIGWLSLFSEALEGGVDLGFHNAIVSENPAYEARQITEHMGEWLSSYGDAPFVLYLHYNTMHGPYKPPFSKIDLVQFLRKPFGLNQKKQLYDSLGRYWDDEFLNIQQKLKDLGIYDDVDVIVTADHGAQFNDQPWEYLAGVPNGLTGGYGDKGHSLLDEEVRVPLVVHLAHLQTLNDTQIKLPTAHIDLFPTLYSLAGGETPSPGWRGLDLSTAWKTQNPVSFDELLQKRTSIYFDAHRYAGLLYWGEEFKNSPIKYIRQLEPDNVKLYLTHNPWENQISYYQPESFSTVDFTTHTEKWLPSLGGEKLKQAREAYFLRSPASKILRLIPKYTGIFSAKLAFARSENQVPAADLMPSHVTLTQTIQGSNIVWTLQGSVAKGDAIWINTHNAALTELALDPSLTPLVCHNGISTAGSQLVSVLEHSSCAFFAPPDGMIEANYTDQDKPVVIQKSLSSEQVEPLEGKGAGEALQNALREWGYAK